MQQAPFSYATCAGARPGTTLLKLAGPLTLTNLFVLQNDLRAIDSLVLIVDMGGVTYMDSAGLGLLMSGYVSAQKSQRKFLLAAVNDRVSTLLHMTRVDSIMPIFPSVEAAEASL